MNYGCDVSASFRNDGGFGNTVATFYLLSDDKSGYVTKCSVATPHADEGDSVTARCHADDQNLENYLRTGRYMHLDTRVSNNP